MGSWEQDLRSGETLWSDGMYRILDLAPVETGRDETGVLAHVHPEDRERMRQMLADVAERPEEVPEAGIEHAVRLVRDDGSVRELRAHYGVSQALREWESFELGVVDLLRRVATALDYAMASLWLWDASAEALACRAFWRAPGLEPGDYEPAVRALTFRAGDGNTGRAWQTLEAVVTADVATDPDFRPRDIAVARGIASAVAFPAVGPNGPVAVLSFDSFEHRVPSAELLRTLTAIGRDLGRFLSRRPADLGLRPLSERQLEVLRFAAEGHEFTVFPDGRAIIKGTSDLERARVLYAKYIGH